MDYLGETDVAKRILVAEDNPALAAVVRLHLEHAGFEVTVARDGREAWNCLQRQDFDLLVTDHQMPELSGCELLCRMRQTERLASVPVLMLTAKGLEFEREQVRASFGVLDVLPKPFSPRQLVDQVESCLAPGVPSG